MTEPLLRVRDLRVCYGAEADGKVAVDGVSFDVMPGEILGLAGESGSGKSTIAHAILRTLAHPALISGGSVWFEGEDVLEFSLEQMRRVRFRKLALVMQSAMNALNPILRIEDQITDLILAHEAETRESATRRAEQLLDWVDVDPRHLRSYPHQLSGGMRQRCMIAMALALRPKLLLMDEPTTALDVVVQKSILERILWLKSQLEFSVVFITHDLELLFDFADRLLVLYAGRLAELGPSGLLRSNPLHPYTDLLTRASPSLEGPLVKLQGIPGAPPSLGQFPPGCRFHPRCPRAEARCTSELPEPAERDRKRSVACHFPLA